MTTPIFRAATTVIVYAAAMAISLLCLTHVFGLSYLSPAMPEVMVYFMAGMAIIASIGYRLYATVDLSAFSVRGRPRLSAWFIPAIIMVVVLGATIASTATVAPSVHRVVATVVLFALVGYAEELVFRGIVLSYALSRLQPVMAVIVSALLFSAFHAINILGALPPAAVVQQLIMTFIAGIFLAGLTLAAGCLWPVMVVHFAWDLLITLAVQTGSHTPPALMTSFGIEFLTACAILIWVARRSESFAQPKAQS